MRPEDKQKIIDIVVERVIKDIESNENLSLETTINDNLYHERRRLEKDKKNKRNKLDAICYKKVSKMLPNSSEEEKKEILINMIQRFVNEIVGNFSDKVYKFTTRVIPPTFSLLLNTLTPRSLLSHLPKFPDISERIIIKGEIELLQKLEKIGTILLLPTHSSNMDSIVIGWALHRINLPPFTYGAGINLFTNKLISFFMNNLGAYKVDRKKSSNLYKSILKEYATCTLEHGYNNLFFPGGTRSRSGAIEDHLKLGLLGTSMKAYTNNLLNKNEKPNFFVVPCTISYELVLEAENLIEDFLKETGRSRYIIEDDEFSQPRRILGFLRSIMKLDSRIYVNFCPAMDLFGNRVDKNGISYDKRGRPVDISRYMKSGDKITFDDQRDRVYIKELGEEVKKSYLKNNIIMCTHLVAFTIFELLKKHNPQYDLYRLLRIGDRENHLLFREVSEMTEKILTILRKMASMGNIELDDQLEKSDVSAIIDEALRHFRSYHTRVVLFRRGDQIYPNDLNVLFYYHNRLQGYNLEREVRS